MNRTMLAASVTVVASTFACVAPAKRLDDYLSAGRYAEARAILEDEKVGLSPSPTAAAKAMELRTRFTEELESVASTVVAQLLSGGSTHDAKARALEYRSLCPWSERISVLVEQCDGMVTRIATVEADWYSVLSSDAASTAEARRFLAEIAAERPWILDSERMRSLEATAVRAVVTEWAASLANDPVRQEQAAEAVCADLAKAGIAAVAIDELRLALKIRATLPASAGPGVRLSNAQLSTLVEARKGVGVDGTYECSTTLAPCIEAVWASFERWQADVHSGILASEGVTYDELAEAEAWMPVARHGEALRLACARAHARFARRRAPQGTASALALLHALRAQALGLAADDADVVEARTLAEATWAATPTPVYRLDIYLQPKVDPEVRGLVLAVLTSEMTEASGALSRMDPYSRDPDVPRVVLSVRDAVLIADTSDVHDVRSTYFSHFQTVANPRKSYLESRVESAKRDVNFKESSYKSAVSSHNIWPTALCANESETAFPCRITVEGEG